MEYIFRGHQVRKERKEGEEEKKEEETKEEIDIDLNDPDTEAAAIKIQVIISRSIAFCIYIILSRLIVDMQPERN